MLYIFDLDGTLVVRYGEQPLPDVIETLVRLRAKGSQLAVATNQAGPAWGVATGQAKYPDPRGLGARFRRIATDVSQLTDVPWYVAVGDDRLSLSTMAYGLLMREFEAGATGLRLHLSASPTWRKPAPGMLLAACKAGNVMPCEAVFVGDSDTDAEAAARAAVGFVPAAEFFGWPPADPT